MIPAYMAIQKFYDLYFARDTIAYWMGAKGELLTRQRLDELCNAYPDYFNSRYSPERLEELKRWSENKIGFDCSGLVCACFDITGLSSWTLRENMSVVTSVKDCKAGSILWKPGHVEIDLGYGATGGIRSEGHTIEINDNGTAGFEIGGEYKYANYSMMYNF